MMIIATDPVDAEGKETRFPDKVSPVIWGICSPQRGIAMANPSAARAATKTTGLRISEE
jgi:hypothetical protein